MNRNERTELFMSLYLTEVENAPDAKRYTCYIRAEAAIENRTGKRQYVKYETFKASMSRREKIKRSNRLLLKIN